DGSYTSELLIKKNYKVFGLFRKSATGNKKNLTTVLKSKNFKLIQGDITDPISLNYIIDKCDPDEIYNFADQDHVGWSYAIPSYSMRVTALSVIDILEIIRKKKKKIKYFQPISSNIFGLTSKKKQNEDTLYNPNSIYALAKTTAIYACKMYNRIYNVHACGAIFYNHESPRRTSEYVSKKIIEQSVQIYLKKRKYLYLGDITANIDWGYAKEYVEAAWKIMQNKKPDFFIIASGKKNSVKDFVSICFNQLGLNYNKHIKIDKKLLRPSKTSSLVGDISKAKKQIKFNPKVDLKKLINIMIKNELKKY
ncbi:GDP-mannose 4,6-dehydratase, partial [Candidatus Pelagibacter ubique]|nr:GDP-mannose 4,6-dehydratase [Candidatus Pelagibacter ubique]